MKSEHEVTYEQVLSFRNNAIKYQEFHPKEKSLFLHAVAQVMKSTKQANDDYMELYNELQVKHAKKDDKTKMFVLDKNDNYTFDEEGKKSFYKDHRALLNTVVNVSCYQVDAVPDDVSYLASSIFYPFVTKEEFPEYGEKAPAAAGE